MTHKFDWETLALIATQLAKGYQLCGKCGTMWLANESLPCPRCVDADPSDDCRPDGAPILCGAQYCPDKTDEFAETFCCVLAQGHKPNIHKTRTGKLFGSKPVGEYCDVHQEAVSG